MPYPHEHRHACILFIDIFVDIIDNYGDIGWVEELMRASYTKIRYRIVTSTPELVSAFLLRNTVDEKLYRICPQKEYIPLGASPVVILSFHKKINPRLFPSHTLFLRVNYLSFQSFAQDIHLRHHIDSTSTRPIIELSYSPLSHTGGIIKGIDTEINRQEWLLSVGLDSTLSDKKWRMIFVYNATFARLDFDEENTVYFIIGRKSTQPSNQLTSIPAHQHPSSPASQLFLPWLESTRMWQLLDLADGSIIRGEVSIIRALYSGKAFFWDMYKEIGGMNTDESTAFLEWFGQNEEYTHFHNELNLGNKRISLKHLFGIDRNVLTKQEDFPDFLETLEKTIDTYGFSI